MINSDRSDEPEPPIDLDARFEASVEAWRARRAATLAMRQDFADARKIGLRRRYANKLSRNRRESAQPEENE